MRKPYEWVPIAQSNHEYYTSYATLQQSAAQGCKLCKVISTSILADSGEMPTKQPATDLAVKMLLSKYRKDGNPQDLLVVRMGSEIVTSLEILITKSIYSPQITYQRKMLTLYSGPESSRRRRESGYSERSTQGEMAVYGKLFLLDTRMD